MPDDITAAIQTLNELLNEIRSHQSERVSELRLLEIEIDSSNELNDLGFDNLKKQLDTIILKHKDVYDACNSQIESIRKHPNLSPEDKVSFQKWKEYLDQFSKHIDLIKEKYDRSKNIRDSIPDYARFCNSELASAKHLIEDELRDVSELKNKLEQNSEFKPEEFEKIETLIFRIQRLKELKTNIESALIKLQTNQPSYASNKEYQDTLEHAQEGLKRLNKAIVEIEDLKKQYNSSVMKEKRDVVRGLHQNQLYEFTYRLRDNENKKRVLPAQEVTRSVGYLKDRCGFEIHPLLESAGLRCTAAVPIDEDTEPIEIQINFFGTIDAASFNTDTEKGGPGQEKLKKYEAKLLERVGNLVQQVSESHPGKQIRLKIAGHSLGGSLAKGFTHTLQRAIAVQNDSPQEVTKKICDALPAQEKGKHEADLNQLEAQLTRDQAKFKIIDSLKKVTGVTLYTIGSPGVSHETDKSGTLLTYYHNPQFLRVYNHYHEEDIIPKYGEAEFLSGRGLEPRIEHLYSVKYSAELSASEVKSSGTLPLPNVTKRVMAAHNKDIYCHPERVKTEISRLNKASFLSEKYEVSEIKRQLVRAISSMVNFIGPLFGVEKYARHEVAEPTLSAYRDKQQAQKEQLNNLRHESTEEKKMVEGPPIVHADKPTSL